MQSRIPVAGSIRAGGEPKVALVARMKRSGMREGRSRMSLRSIQATLLDSGFARTGLESRLRCERRGRLDFDASHRREMTGAPILGQNSLSKRNEYPMPNT
jgi:hypothetical protein